MYKIVFFVPLAHSEQVKNAMFAAGGGRVGNYENCSFETEGLGQFRPLKGSNPYLGQHGEVERVRELRVEMVVLDSLVGDVLRALKKAHPYEVPAYDVIRLEDL